METEMKRLVLGEQKFLFYLRNIQLKYKLSDWELARTKTRIYLPVQGYIHSDKQRAIDYDGLKLWFDANWSPVENQLRWNTTYQAWVQDDPADRHVQVDGTPAVARAGRHKKDEQLLHSALPTLPFSIPGQCVMFAEPLYRFCCKSDVKRRHERRRPISVNYLCEFWLLCRDLV